MSRSLLNRFSSGHSLMPRGLAAGSIDGVRSGRFDRLIPATNSRKPDDHMLQALAKFMVTSFPEEHPPKPDQGKPIDEAEPADENATIPAAYTYFGQFVDHDLTLDTTDFGQSQKDLSATVDFRTPALDLDCVYGGGPADQPSIYRNAKNGFRHLLRLGDPIKGAHTGMIRQDLLRVPPVSKSDSAALALIGDKRNDENKIVAQFQVIMITLHNKIYEDDSFHHGIADAKDRFDAAKDRFDHTVKLVRWHYQWVIVHDFLIDKLLMRDALKTFGSIYHPHLPLYGAVMANGRTFPFMPVEFSGAVYRLGHSMVRPSYSLNTDRVTLPPAPGEVDNPRIATFGKQGRDLRGFGERISKDWAIDWGFFVDGVKPVESDKERVLPQPSYRIDTRVGDPLAHLPEFEGHPPIEANLAYRNLSRAVGLALPTGEEMAKALKIKPMTTDEVWSAGSRLYREEDKQAEIEARHDAIKAHKFAQHFAHRTPLWYYILREAEFYGCERPLPTEYLKHAKGDPDKVKQESTNFGGLHLGPVGSHVVLETFLALLWHDRRSFVHDRCWQPHHKLNPSGDEFTLGQLINYALA